MLSVPTIDCEPIETYSLRVANNWALGHQGFNDGILVVLANKEHRVRIELGTGMEPYISNEEAQQIIDTAMVPEFRTGNFYAGIKSGVSRLMGKARAFVVPPIFPPAR